MKSSRSYGCRFFWTLVVVLSGPAVPGLADDLIPQPTVEPRQEDSYAMASGLAGLPYVPKISNLESAVPLKGLPDPVDEDAAGLPERFREERPPVLNIERPSVRVLPFLNGSGVTFSAAIPREWAGWIEIYNLIGEKAGFLEVKEGLQEVPWVLKDETTTQYYFRLVLNRGEKKKTYKLKKIEVYPRKKN